MLLLLLCIQSLLFAFHFHGNVVRWLSASTSPYSVYILHVRRCFNAVRSNAGNWFKFRANELDAVCLALTHNFDAVSCMYNIYKYTSTHALHIHASIVRSAGTSFFLLSWIFFPHNSHPIPMAMQCIFFGQQNFNDTEFLIPFYFLLLVYYLSNCHTLCRHPCTHSPIHPFTHTYVCHTIMRRLLLQLLRYIYYAL